MRRDLCIEPNLISFFKNDWNCRCKMIKCWFPILNIFVGNSNKSVENNTKISENAIFAMRSFFRHTNWENRCQFHQHYMREFFLQMSFRQLFYVHTYVEKSFRIDDVRTKFSYVKCWWNWRPGTAFGKFQPTNLA